MAEITNELMFEVLKTIQSRLDKLDAGLSEVRQEIVSVRLTLLGMQNDIHNIYGMLGRHDDRLGRIERRLELRELAEPAAPYRPT